MLTSALMITAELSVAASLAFAESEAGYVQLKQHFNCLAKHVERIQMAVGLWLLASIAAVVPLGLASAQVAVVFVTSVVASVAASAAWE